MMITALLYRPYFFVDALICYAVTIFIHVLHCNVYCTTAIDKGFGHILCIHKDSPLWGMVHT